MCPLFLLLLGLTAVRDYDVNELRLAIDLLAQKTKPGKIMKFEGQISPMEVTLFNENRRWLLIQYGQQVILKRLEDRE